MAQASKPSGSSGGLRFGDFTVDLHTGELHRNGARVRLQDQPFQVLALLTRRAGEVVTREELRQHLWPADTFVDFDNSLNASIAKIREALGDSPESPRFIETLPRRGYRFIAGVNAIERVLDEPPSSSAAVPVQLQVEWRRANRRTLAAMGLGLTIVATGVVLWALRSPHFPKVVRYVQITNDGKPKTRPVSFINILLTDGSRIYFALGTRKGWELAEVSATGGEALTLPLPVDGIIPDDINIAHDHSRLLFAGGAKGTELPGSPYWVLSLPGGPVERLGKVLARGASWSQDGNLLAYAQDRSLYVAKSDGSEARAIASFEEIPFQPRWSPDAKVLRFYLYDTKRGSGALWEIFADGTNPHALFPTWSPASETCCGLWTSDGKYFVFQATRGNVSSIWVRLEQRGLIRSPSLAPVQLTFGPMNFLAPTPSPDGKHLFAIGGQDRGELMRYDSLSGQFVTYFSGFSAEGLDFSRDGESVLYTAFPEGTMWRSRVDGSERIQVSPPSWRAAYPRWSPDGRTVAFMGAKSDGPSKSDGDWRIYLIRSEGGSPEPLLGSEELQLHPNWSPSGDAIIFGNPWWSAAPAIHLVDLGARRASILPNSEGLYSPSWSPDGRFVAAISKDLRRVALFDFTTQRWNELALMDSVGHLTWSRKGEYVYFDAATKGSVSIYRVDARSHRIERVAAIPPHVAPPFELFSPWTGLDPNDSPLLMRDTSVQEIYALDLQPP